MDHSIAMQCIAELTRFADRYPGKVGFSLVGKYMSAWRDEYHGRSCYAFLPQEEDDRREQAYASTSTDGDAAEQLGITRTAFREWRHSRKIPAKRGVGNVSKYF